MNIEVINTGSELMLGRTLNTHQQWLCRRLADLGYVVTRQTAIADTPEAICGTVREALGRADLVITTGGLGPTSDDLTRDLLAQMLGRPLHEDPQILEKLHNYFASRKRVMPVSTRVQAMVPEGAIVLANDFGTAPGLALSLAPNPYRAGHKAWLVLLPGPPRELRPMFQRSVAPLIRQEFPHSCPYVCRTLRSMGLGESLVQEKVEKHLGSLVSRGLDLGYCARPGRVDVRLAAGVSEATEIVTQAEAIVRRELGHLIYGTDDQELESVLVETLTHRGETLALAESCTGGYIAHLITNVPGASQVLRAGWVTYSNASKSDALGVLPTTIATHGAVSAETVAEMARGARERAGSTYALAVTGIAGPTGGSPEKPVGTVFIGLAGPNGVETLKQNYPTDRETFKQLTAQHALDWLRRKLA
jgi:nicotinamide-nucleotide amidase